jgi:hypothetical protein
MIPSFGAQLVFLASNEAFVNRRDAAEAIYGNSFRPDGTDRGAEVLSKSASA